MTTLYISWDFGKIVTLEPRANARRETLSRLLDGTLVASYPKDLSEDEVCEIIERLLPRMPKAKECPVKFSEGMTIECDGASFTIGRQDKSPFGVLAARTSHAHFSILVGCNLSMDSPKALTLISNMLRRVAVIIAPDIILPLAQNIATRLQIHPKEWKFRASKRTLGTCRGDGSITLSSMLVFLPQELKEFVICHELAHLTQMNHSSRFHSLCDAYLNGREKELRKKLRQFQWPLLK